MTLPALPVTQSSQPAADAPVRGADTAASTDAPAFSNVLSQQRDGAARATESPRAERSDRAARRADAEPADPHVPVTPDEALSLILDSAALPLMQPATTEIRTAHLGTARREGSSDARAPRMMLDTKASPVLTDTDDSAAHDLAPTAQDSRRFRLQGADTLTTARTPLAADLAAPTPARNAPSHHARATVIPSQTAQLAPSNTPAGQQDTDVLSFQTTALSSQATNTSLATAVDASQATLATPAGATVMPSVTVPASVTIPAQLTTPMTHPQWPQDFSRQIVQLAQNLSTGGHTVQMHVNPPELGPIQITLHVGESIAQASFVSPHANVRQTLENALPHLEQQLAQAGLSLGQADVGDQQPGQQAQAQPGQTASRAGESAFSLDGELADATALPATPATPRTINRPDALVDTFA